MLLWFRLNIKKKSALALFFILILLKDGGQELVVQGKLLEEDDTVLDGLFRLFRLWCALSLCGLKGMKIVLKILFEVIQSILVHTVELNSNTAVTIVTNFFDSHIALYIKVKHSNKKSPTEPHGLCGGLRCNTRLLYLSLLKWKNSHLVKIWERYGLGFHKEDKSII